MYVIISSEGKYLFLYSKFINLISIFDDNVNIPREIQAKIHLPEKSTVPLKFLSQKYIINKYIINFTKNENIHDFMS